MNSWVLPRLLLENIKISHTDDTAYFLFDTELAKSEFCATLLLESVTAALRAMAFREASNFPVQAITQTALETQCKKLLLKYSYKSGLCKLELFERE